MPITNTICMLSVEQQEILDRIHKLEEQLKNVKGTPCITYSRVVGYFSPTSQWNKGKVSEWSDRTPYNVPQYPKLSSK